MENNKLIAEFMGFHRTKKGYIVGGFGDGTFGLAEELHFHTSWDWLMPVVEKIEEIAIDDDNLTIKEHRFQFDMGYTQCSIYDHVRDGVIASADMATKLSSTYRAVIEFIKAYNDEE